VLYARASQTIVDALEVDFAGVLEMLSDGRMLTRAGYRIPDGLEGEIASVIDEGSQPHYVLGAEEEVVVVDDLQAETRFDPVPTLLELGIRSGLTAAIPGRTRPVGSLGAWTRERREFDSTEVELFGLMAAGIGLAVERRRTERRLETHRSLGEVLAMSDTLVEAAPRIVEAICEALDWDAGIVWLADRRREVLRAATVWVDANDPGAERFREEIERMTFAHGERLPGRVWAVGEPQWISYIPPEEERLKRRTLHDAGLRSVLAFPIRRGATVLGVVEILAREMIQPDEDLLEDCERIGRQIGEFIARDQAQRELVQSRDELRTVLRSMPVGVTVVGPDGRYRFVNEVTARINDSTPEELVGVSALDAISGVTITEEDGTELPREELPLFKALRGEPSPPRLVRFHGPAVREQRWAIAHAIPLRESEDSPPTAVVSVVENVTELKEIQEALRMSEARHREISDALQRGLLPPEASEVAGLDFAARLHTEEAGTRIGGDFYDVFPLSGGRYAIVIGDVSGKGVEAAGLTALARYTIRTAAMHDPRPVGVLRCLNEAMLSSGGREHFLTAIYSIVEPKAGGHQVTIASGGHPKPLLVRAGGDVIPIEAQGSLLGWFEHLDLAEGGAELRPGDALILFTDGITEAGYRDRSPGTPVTDDALRELLATCAGEPAERIADAVEQRVLTAEGGELRDDATMVVVSSRAR
jgi:phosphoserine phosphatase RsbU/P